MIKGLQVFCYMMSIHANTKKEQFLLNISCTLLLINEQFTSHSGFQCNFQ